MNRSAKEVSEEYKKFVVFDCNGNSCRAAADWRSHLIKLGWIEKDEREPAVAIFSKPKSKALRMLRPMEV